MSSFKIANVNIFDGQTFQKGDVGVIDGVIRPATNNIENTIDGTDKFLIPGLIDCHVHLRGKGLLEKLAQHGVTTALDMGVVPPSLVGELKARKGVTDIRSAGPPATSPGSQHSRIKGLEDYLIADPSQAQDWVDQRIEQGSDYIKMVADTPGPSQEILSALVIAAHNRGRVVVVHAMKKKAFEMALEARADYITHLPHDEPLSMESVQKMKDQGTIAIPTLTILEALPARKGPPFDYQSSVKSFHAVLEAGIPILAGSDSNAEETCPLEHGNCLHHELKIMVDAGLDKAAALRSATEAPCSVELGGRAFGITDRGKIANGLRADLVLLGKNPLDNIENTRSVERVWIGGEEYQRSLTNGH